MGEGLDYDGALRLLRELLCEAAANTWAFRLRARRSPTLLSERGWMELAEVESRLRHCLEQGIRHELRTDAWTYLLRVRTVARGLRLALVGERAVVERLRHTSACAPLEAWRRGAPQLEQRLWPLLVPRTHHLANALSLALNEPAPFPPLIWHPGRGEFR